MSLFQKLKNFFAGSDPVATGDAVVSTTIGLIHDAEGLFPAAGNGANKLEHVRTGLQSAWDSFKTIAIDFETAWPTIEKAIADLVSLYVAIGAFKRGSSRPS